VAFERGHILVDGRPYDLGMVFRKKMHTRTLAGSGGSCFISEQLENSFLEDSLMVVVGGWFLVV